MHERKIVDDEQRSSPPKQRASWYTPGVSDGLGDRLLMFDNSDAPSLELLRFRPDFAEVPGFEAALRERVARLAQFHHPAFAQVRSVQRLEPDGDLALVSNCTPGTRLSEVLQQARGPAFAAGLIRQLAPALVMLQQHDAGLSHGLLSPDRIIVSPGGRLTIVEHVVGPAIGTLDLGIARLASIGIHVPPGRRGTGQGLDVATDWYQLGLVALSVLLGRPVTASELPRLESLLDGMDPSTAAALPPLLRQWLDRSLQIAGPRIESGADARAAFDELLQKESAPSRTQVRARSQTDAPVAAAGQFSRVVEPGPDTIERTGFINPGPRPTPAAHQPPAVRPATVARPGPRRPGSLFDLDSVDAEVVPQPSRRPITRSRADLPSPGSTDANASPAVTRARPRSRAVGRTTVSTAVVAVLGLLAAAEAGVIVGLVRAVWFASSPPIVVQNGASGEQLLVSSLPTTALPLHIAVAPDLRWLRVTTGAGAGTAAGAAGAIQITAPIALEVFEQSRRLGSVPGDRIELAVGRHEIELVNVALGYRLRQGIEVEAGQIVSLHVAPPDGWMTVDAAPGSEVSIDGRVVGRTPLTTLSLSAGEHEIRLQHLDLGSDRQRVTVRSQAITSVTANLR